MSSYSKRGLIFCGGQFSTNAFCDTKLVQLLLSSILLGWIIFDMVHRYLRQKTFVSLFFGLCTLMSLALICNIAFCLNHEIHAFNYLEGFFFNTYFICIVYYVAVRLLNVMQSTQYYLWIVHSIFAIFLVVGIFVLIQNFMTTYANCYQLWYLIVNGISIILSVLLTVIGYNFTQNQIQRIEGIDNPIHYKNPLPNIWFWISANIFSQVSSFVEDLFFLIRGDLHCAFSHDFTVDEVVKLIFAFLSFHVGMIGTLIFFRMKYKNQSQNLTEGQMSDDARVRRASVNIELIQQFASTA